MASNGNGKDRGNDGDSGGDKGQSAQLKRSRETTTSHQGRLAAIAPYQWKPGQSGNPAGRPKGSRHKLAEDFLADLHADWLTNGREVLEAARKQKPADYLKVVALVLPKEIKHTFSDMDDDALASKIDELAKAAGLQLIEINPKH